VSWNASFFVLGVRGGFGFFFLFDVALGYCAFSVVVRRSVGVVWASLVEKSFLEG